MNRTRHKASVFSPWPALAAWTVLLFAGLPAAPLVWDFLRDLFPAAARWTPFFVVPAAAAAAAAAALRFDRRHRRRALGRIALWAAGFGGCVLFLTRYPVEPFHAGAYVVLALLARRAFRQSARDLPAWALSGLFVFTVGTADELIQWLLPNRVFDPRDLLLNWSSGLFGLLLSACMETGRSAKEDRRITLPDSSR